MSAVSDGELLERLGECLLADAAAPDARARAALHLALDEAPAPSVLAPHTQRQWRRIRRPVAATIAATILLSGSAAAAVETNTLPGPLRSLAVTLGLPVTPSAFTQAQSAVSDLTRALAARDPVLVRADLASLEAALAQLSPSARAELGPGVVGLIAQAEIFLASQPDDRASAGARGGDGSGNRESPTDDATGAHPSSGGAEGGEPSETNDADGSGSGSPAPTGTGGPATVSSGQGDGDDVSGGVVATGTSPTGTAVDGGGSTGTSDGGSTTTATTGTSDGSDGSGTSGGSDGSDGSGTSSSDGGSGGSDGGGYVS